MALEDVLEGFALFFKVIYFWIVDSIKALLPLRVLPRKDVRGQTVLITGAGSGLGRLLAKEFAKLDTKVILWDVNETGNLETKKFVEELGAEAHVYTVDLSDRKAINKVAEAVKKDHGGVDILINNAGIVTGKKIFDCPDELMEKTMFVNGHAPLFTTKQFLPGMLERDRGHLVTIASMAGLAGTAGLVDYCASKHAAVGYARSLAAELRKLGKSDTIHTTTVCPFYIDTGMFEGVQLKFPMVLLKPEYVVDNILEAVLTNKEIIQLPKTMYINTYLSSFLPSRVLHILAEHAGVNDSMETFVGRNKRD